ncbi:MAG: GGDEF domain-containing protein [Lachnospiraceae bacterium]
MNFLKKSITLNENDKVRIKENQNEVNKYNKTMAMGIARISTIVLLVPLLVSPFFARSSSRIITCLISMAVLLTISILCEKGYLDKHPLIALYITLSTGSALAIMLSVVASPDHRATVLIVAFCIVPIVYIDYFYRKLFFLISILIIHFVLALYLKGTNLALVDAMNCVCILSIGSFVGYLMQQTKLTAFELEKNLIYERETDILTGLKNRRKMIELFGAVREERIPMPCCAILLDIDHFKEYNDRYGHTVGDELLHVFGKTLLTFEAQHKIKFYRYGGEEFSAFIWDCSLEEQAKILEQIRVSTESMKIEHGITISIGYMNIIEQSSLNLENALTLADSALYEAKKNGRNQVVCYKP